MAIKIRGKIIIYFAGKGLTALISLLIIPLFIRWFGEENYGIYILTYVTFLIFISGAIGWINQSIIKFHGDFKDRFAFYKKAHNISYIFSIIATLPLLIAVSFNLNNSGTVLLYITIGLSFIFACRYTSLLIEKQSEIKPINYSLAEIIRLLSFLVTTFLLQTVEYFMSLELIFIGLLFSYILSYLYLKRSFNLNDFKIEFSHNSEFIKKFLAYGMPLSIWMVFSPGTNGIDKYILNYYLGPSILAYYAAVYDVIFKIFIQVVNPINSVFQPLLMNINSQGDEKLFTKTLNKGLIYLILICTPLLCLIYYFQGFILTNYLGISDEQVINLLRGLIIPIALSAIIWQLAIVLQKRIEAKEKTLSLTIYIIIVVSLNSSLSIWLIPKYNFGVLGYINLFGSLVYLALIILKNRTLLKKESDYEGE